MKFPSFPQKGQSVAETISDILRWMRSENIVGVSGGRIIVGPNGKTIILDRVPPSSITTGGRFIVSVGKTEVTVSEGSVAWIVNSGHGEPTIIPEIPGESGAEDDSGPAGGAIASFPLAGETAGDYEVGVELGDGDSKIVFRKVDDAPSDESAPFWQLATMTFEADGDKLKLSAFSQPWQSDIPWIGRDSSSSESSSSSSEWEKSNNAIVIMPWHADGHGAMATVEANEVLFEFCCRRVPLTGTLTRAKLDPRFMFLCEPGSLEIMAAPVGPKPCVVGAEIVGDEILLRTACLGHRSNDWVNFKVTGIRRGFSGWDAPSRTAEQKAQADRSNASTYER